MTSLVLPAPAKICVMDPPWKHQQFGAKKHGAAKAHYEEKKSIDIAAVPVGDWTDSTGSLLFLWCTGPQGADARHVEVAKAYGFKLQTQAFTWIKVYPNCRRCGKDWDLHEQKGFDLPGGCYTSKCPACEMKLFRGIGFYTMSNSEAVWMGTRGKTPWSKLRARKDIPNTIIAPIREHSRKPEAVQDRIEMLWPEMGPRLELYATRDRTGWTCWGNKLGQRLSSEGAATIRRPRSKVPL